MRYVALLISAGCVALFARPPGAQLHQNDFRPLLLRPALARTISKPFLPLLVDVLWLRSLNAIGLKDSEQKNLALHEYGVAITELDPRFRTAYEFLGLNIPFHADRNVWVGGDLACDMFRRGLRVFPKDLKLHLYLGFSLFHHQRKFSEAADVFSQAAKLPDALPYMALLAIRLKTHSGSAEDALDMTQSLLSSDLDNDVRQQLEQRVRELEVEVVLQQVDRAARAYFDQTGRSPRTLDELRAGRFYDGPSIDPEGGVISIDPEGQATSTSLQRRLHLYE
jgi:hypothetical protein